VGWQKENERARVIAKNPLKQGLSRYLKAATCCGTLDKEKKRKTLEKGKEGNHQTFFWAEKRATMKKRKKLEVRLLEEKNLKRESAKQELFSSIRGEWGKGNRERNKSYLQMRRDNRHGRGAPKLAMH